MHATIRAHRARKARAPRHRWQDHRPLPASIHSTRRTVDAARSRLGRSYRYGERSYLPWLKVSARRREWTNRRQKAAIRQGGMTGATAWRSGAIGRPVPRPPVDRSKLPREERMGRPQRR